MDGRFGVGKVLIELAAVSGTNSQQLVHGTDGMNKPWPGSVQAHILIVNHGINDAGLGTTAKQYRANLMTFAKAPAIVVFETPNPVKGQRYNTKTNATIMRRVAAQTHSPLADVFAYVTRLPDWTVHLVGGMHPDQDLQTLIARDVTAPTLIPLVKKLRCE